MFRKLVFLSAVCLLLGVTGGARAQEGKVLFEFWFGGSINDNLANLKADPRFPLDPDTTEYLDSFTADKPASDYYGGRGRALLTAPETGDYTFWVWSDDSSEVWLSSDEDPANAELIASVTGWTGANEWGKYPTQKSAPKALEAGKRYYLEALYTDGTGGGNIGVGWGGPGIGDGPTIIAGAYLTAVPVYYPAYAPVPADGADSVTEPLFSWTVGNTAVMHDVYFGKTPALDQPTDYKSQWPNIYFHMEPLEPAATYYWRVDAIDAVTGVKYVGKVWSFTVMPITAYSPSPINGAIYRNLDTKLSWKAGNGAATHDVYLSSSQEDVTTGAAGAFKVNQAETAFDPNGLAFDTTYYWRVDEINGAGQKVVGDVWSFKTTFEAEHGARGELWLDIGGTAVSDLTGNERYPGAPDVVQVVPNFQAPVDIGDNFGARMLAWLTVPVAGEYTFWVASDDASQLYLGAHPHTAEMIAQVTGWTPSEAWDWNPSSKPIYLDVGKYYLGMIYKEGGGGDNCAAAWQGPAVPQRELIIGGFIEPLTMVWADLPKPANGAVDAAQTLDLSWAAGTGATGHDLYIGLDEEAVNSATTTSEGIYMGRLAADVTTFTLSDLPWDTTVYWRVDEVGAAEGELAVGRAWNFKTANFLALSMDEKTLTVNNTVAPFVSELSFDVPADWTGNNAGELALRFIGAAAATGGFTLDEATGTYAVTGEGADVWGSSDQFTYVYKTLKGDGEIIARVTGIGTGTSTWAKGGVMVRETLDANSKHMIMALTGGDGNGIAFQGRFQAAGANSSSMNGDITAAAPYWVKLTRQGNAITAYHSADGADWKLWTDTSPDNAGGPISNPIDVPMAETVFIGLFVTSHAGGELRTYTFDNVSTAGDVPAGPFTLWENVGLSGNGASPIYVAVEDAAGQVSTVMYSDPAATQIAEWTDWKIPFAEFAGVDLTNVAKLYFGAGDGATSVSPIGAVRVDDIRVLTPPPTILWVSFHGADDAPHADAAAIGFTAAPDIGYTDLLKAAGYNVVRYITTGTPDPAVVNAADLVIISRSVDSGHYSNAAATAWNSISAPMIIVNGYTLRKSRMGYTTGGTMKDITGDIKLAVANPAHPIFAGISLTDGVMTNPYAGVALWPTDGTATNGISVNTSTPDDEAIVLATMSEASGEVPAGAMVIAEWPAGASLTHDGGAGTDVLAGHRLVLLTGSRENQSRSSKATGIFDLHTDGANIFLNAVAYMLQ